MDAPNSRPREGGGPIFFLKNEVPAFAGTTMHRSLGALLQLLEDLGILQGRDVLLDLLAFRDRAQKAPHDLSRARLRQVVAKADVLRLRDGADLLRHPLA